MSNPPNRGLIVTADDFGLHPAINEAVEQAHRHGVLTAASLMVAGPAASDAVARARRHPGLRVGLHLVLADGPACLPAERIPDLAGVDGRFGDRMVRDGFRFLLLPRVRRQLAAEIEAQFAAYQVTGLPLDHANAHKHFHLHPSVLGLMIAIGRRYGLRAVRLPAEDAMPAIWRWWVGKMAAYLDEKPIFHNDAIHGIARTGAMDKATVLTGIEERHGGITEIYLHPATADVIVPSMAGYRHTDELAALLSPRVRTAIQRSGLSLGGFADFRQKLPERSWFKPESAADRAPADYPGSR